MIFLAALLAVPEVAEACTALMILYVRWGPAIMAALTEGIAPPAVAPRVAGLLAREQPVVTETIRAAGQKWLTDHPNASGRLMDYLETVIFYKAPHFLEVEVQKARPGMTVPSSVFSSVGQTAAPILNSFAKETQSLLIRHNLEYVKQGEMYVLKYKGVHGVTLGNPPSPSSMSPAAFNAWIVDFLKQRGMT